MDAAESEAFVAFVHKWQVREPEMAIAEVFCPAERKRLFRAWGALLHELREAVFELSDIRVTEVKTAWWAEELIGMGQGRHRHPVTELLAQRPASWSALGRSMLELPDAGARHGNTMEVFDSLLPIARSVVAVESALFGAAESETIARTLVTHWLLQRLPRGLATEDQARIPMHLLARHGVSASQLADGQGDAVLRDWAAELLGAMSGDLAGASVFRRSRARFDAARLKRMAAGNGFAEPPALATLWRAWRSARA